MKIFKKVLPVMMAALLVIPAFPVSAAEIDPDTEVQDNGEQQNENTDAPTVQTDTVTRAGKSWDLGKNDPKEVVAVFSNGVLTLSNEYVYDASSGAEELPNPGLMKDNACSEILSYFSSNEITDVKVVVGTGVQTVGASSFSGSAAISEVEVVSSDFKEFKDSAFANCSNLTTVSINKGAIDKNVFQGTAVSDLQLGSVTEIGDGAFQGSALTKVAIPDTVKKIGSGAFADTKVTEVSGGSNVSSVGEKAFSGGKTIKLGESASDALKAYDWSGAGYTDILLGDTKQIIISFEVNGGTAIAPVTVNAGEAFTAPKPQYSGMTFDGWFTDSAMTKPFADGTVVDSNTTLYAKWHGDYVTLTMELGNGQAATSVQVKYGEKASKPSDPAPSGDKVFGGWFSDSACTTAFSFDTPLTANMTIYAKWGDATFYTVKFDTDGGSTIDNQSVKSGSLATKPADPTKTDYTFDGWYKSNEWKDKWNFDSDKITADTTIYGRFLSNKVTVKFNTNGGSSIASVTVDRGSKLTNPGNPTKDNCEFLGWYKDEGLSKEFNVEADSVTDNMTLYAKWNQTAFTVKWESNGGTAVEPVTANPNALIAKPADPTKAGYYLVGWCKDSDLKNQWNFDTDKVTADVTLYALWAVGDPASVDGNPPGVTNTGAKVPQTGDTSNPLFHGFMGISSLLGAIGVGGVKLFSKKRKFF